ncbi:hypothetical protein [Texcoconibacillus texcoconensis]|uniref:Lipoprotein n=1 Tax=Texcoconibacillus texcoconensis TaxID=1095777 RepID=A0A840QQE1_9BACI|nr:hypothetical protein [Texcoconibacillus texcoconensis]MBB5173569.1 hypothetical protein [Texcoconibacillus texcoconensis]
MKNNVLGLLFFSIVLLSACGDPVGEDLDHYINEELASIIDLEEGVIMEYESVVGSNYTNDKDLYIHLEEVVLPMYLDFIEQLEAINPETSEIRELHEIYISAVNTQYNAMVKLLGAIDYQDHGMVSQSNQMLSEGRAKIREFHNEMDGLIEEYNVEFDIEMNDFE